MAQWDARYPTLLPLILRLQFCGSVLANRTRFNSFSKMKLGR
jgi:hypothetical protein